MGRYTLVDLFAGCGAMTRGFVDTGDFRPIFAVESDPHAARTYGANFGHDHVVSRPIQEVVDFPAADVVIGGPPCQGFSLLNRGGRFEESRNRWRDYFRALEVSKPRVFVLENVPQILDSAEYTEFYAAARALGYEITDDVLNVADFGVPQRRSRAFIVGSAVGRIDLPRETHANPALSKLNRIDWVTFREAVRGLPLEPNEEDWHCRRNPWPETVIRYRAVPPDGGNRFQMQENLEREGLGHLVPPCWRKHRSGSHDVFGRLWWDRPATTIRTEFYKPEKGRYLHPSEHRALTVREAARLMTIPDDFVLPPDQSMTTIARQVGNAVPPLMATLIAKQVVDALDGVVSASMPLAEAA